MLLLLLLLIYCWLTRRLLTLTLVHTLQWNARSRPCSLIGLVFGIDGNLKSLQERTFANLTLILTLYKHVLGALRMYSVLTILKIHNLILVDLLANAALAVMLHHTVFP